MSLMSDSLPKFPCSISSLAALLRMLWINLKC
jgi:hypothetical protein